jgi:hypothetical protein
MLHRQSSRATRLSRSLASGLLCLSGLGIALAAPVSVAAAAPDVAVSTPVVVTPAATCDAGHWPASVQGRPTFHAGSRAGDRIWHDSTGWHLRVTHPGTKAVVFSGTIRSDAALTVKGARLESQDSFTLSADQKSVTYRFVNHGQIDGLDFTTDCAKHLSFAGRMNGHRLVIGRIWIGHRGHHPLQNPFAVRRID